MKFTNELRDFFKITKLRFIGLRREIRLLLILSIISILSIEFFLNETYPLYHFQYYFGVFILKLSYSYLSAFIFYYLIVYSPRERKRVRTYRYLYNKIHAIYELKDDLLLAFFREINPEIKDYPHKIEYSDIKEICKQINPKLPITLNVTEFATFKNHYEFINFKTRKIKTLISELIILNEILDENILHGLTNINDAITNHLTFDINIYSNEEMGYLSNGLYILHFESDEMINYFFKNYDFRYEFEYNKFENQKNQKMK
jgi:hypothetical protein